MSWQIIVFLVFAILAAIVFILSRFVPERNSVDAHPRAVATAASIGLVLIGALFLVFASFTIVGTRQVAIQTSFGRPTGSALNNGLHVKAPWTITHEMDGAVQIDQHKDNGNGDDQRILVRLGNSSTAHADVSIRWQIKQSAAPELYQNYKTFDNVRTNLVTRNLQVALNEVFASFDPLAPQNLNVSPLPQLAQKAADILRHQVGDQVDVLDVAVPTIDYDQGTEDKINQLNQQRAQTSIANEAQKTAEGQSKANEILAQSVSANPNVVVQNCINATVAKGISPLGCWPGVSAMPTVPVGGQK